MKDQPVKQYKDFPYETRDIWAQYDESFQFLQTRKQRWVNQLILLNNLQRGDENIASTLLLTLFNRILSNLYDDKMQVKFIPGEELEQKKVNSLNILAKSDYQEMDKPRLDYDWSWDTLFFGRGYMETLKFDTKKNIMVPEVINPLAFGFDPFFADPKQWRYYWKWVTKSKWEIEALIKSGKIKTIKSSNELSSGIDPYLWDYKVRYEQARMVTPQANDTYQGDVYQIIEMFRYNNEGKKCVYWLDRDFSKILLIEELDLNEDEGWPIVIKEAFRQPHSTVTFSVADLLEDKHRARSVLLNLAFIAAKDKANPLYQYVPDKVQDLSQLFNRQISQHIPVTEIGAVQPLQTQDPLPNSLAAFMQVLSQEANDPVGTGMALSPAKKGKQNATESAIQQQLNDLAQSLQSKVMQQGEKDFWMDWYGQYKRHAKAGDWKIATIVGAKGVTFEKIDLGDIHTKYPPGVMVFSAKDAEYKELVLRRDLTALRPQLQESLGPQGIRNFDKYVLLPKYLQDPTIIDALLPKSIDEIAAENENESINENSMPDVKETDDHEQHLIVHRLAKNTWAKWTHMKWHEELLGMQKKQQMDQQQQGQGQPEQPQQPEGQKPGAKKGEKDKGNPQKAAVPLQTAMQTNIQKSAQK